MPEIMQLRTFYILYIFKKNKIWRAYMQPKAAEFLLTYDICSADECVCDDTLNVSSEYIVSISTDNYAYVQRNSGGKYMGSCLMPLTNPSLRGGFIVEIAASDTTYPPRKDDKANEAIHKTVRSNKNFDDMSVVDIAYEYSREIFRQGGGSCSQNA